jgi:hypothetical protein
VCGQFARRRDNIVQAVYTLHAEGGADRDSSRARLTLAMTSAGEAPRPLLPPLLPLPVPADGARPREELLSSPTPLLLLLLA